jgi:hypothetical protein
MPTLVSCPTCGNSLKAPDQLIGERVKCLRCNHLFTVAETRGEERGTRGEGRGKNCISSPLVPRPSSLPRKPTVSRFAFWLGLASLAGGLAAGFLSVFPATAGFCRPACWGGLLLGGTALALSVIYEECSFGLPFAGTVVSLFSLSLLIAGLSAPARFNGRGEWRAGRAQRAGAAKGAPDASPPQKSINTPSQRVKARG